MSSAEIPDYPIKICPECKKGVMITRIGNLMNLSLPPNETYRCDKCGYVEYRIVE
jgi:predicted RNA-binding Zn-ribbon protein involved in translation (DUF1610 family)